MGPNRDGATVGLAAPFAKITDQFFARIKLGLRRFVAIEIAYQTNAECNIVEKIAMNMSAVDLSPPTVANLDFAIAAGAAVSDYKMIGQPVFHPSDSAVVIIESSRITLSRAAVMHHDKFPTITRNRRPSYFFNHRTSKIVVPLRA